MLNNNDFFCLSIQAESNIYSPFVQEAVVPAVFEMLIIHHHIVNNRATEAFID